MKDLSWKTIGIFLFTLAMAGLLIFTAFVYADPLGTGPSPILADGLRIHITEGAKAVRTTIPWKYRSPVVTAEDKARGFVIVQRGWTLGGISKALYGSYDVSKLMSYNPDIKDKNKIKVHQKIWLRPKVLLTDDERMSMARIAVWKRMKNCFYYRTRVKDYPVTASREWAHEPLNMVQLSTGRLDMQQYFREVLRRTEWVDILEGYRTLVEVTDSPEELLRLSGLIWQESSFKQVRGKHGEIGWGQILPSTGLEILKKNPWLVPEVDVEFLTVEDVRDMLKDVTLNVRMTDMHLEGLGNGSKALRRYNGNGPATVIYEGLVRKKIDRLTKAYNKEISNLFEKKLEEIK